MSEELLKAINQEDQILFPEGDLARGNISEILSPHAECVNMVVYKNSMPKNINKEHLNSIINNEYSHIILTSPSSFINLTKALKGKADLKQLRLICIGSTTASEVELNNIKPAAIARMSNAQGIFDSIVEIYTS